MFDKLKERWRLEEQQERLDHAKRKAQVLSCAPKVFKAYGISKAILFGSLAENRSNQQSDVDLLVMPLPAKRYWDFKHELEQTLKLPVELYTQDDEPGFVDKIIKRGEIIYEA